MYREAAPTGVTIWCPDTAGHSELAITLYTLSLMPNFTAVSESEPIKWTAAPIWLVKARFIIMLDDE